MFETTTSHSSVERDVMAERFEIARAIERRTLPGELARTVRRYGDRDALKWPSRSGWQTLTWREYRDRLRDFSLGLRALGFGSGQFAVLLTGNRPEHVIAAQGVVHAEGTPVALYDAAAPAQIGYIANPCEAT